MEALLRQTRPLEEIVIVDNGSSDGTSALIAERYPQVTLLRMAENLGVGGGLAAGLTYAALEKHHDWVWTFDQDSVPNDDALEALPKDSVPLSKASNASSFGTLSWVNVQT